ncbi:MAG: hypothetical protein Q8K23_11185 [Sulfuritalea sp.]|nr:hypothetical protein [Sulfuritalea sp.]
MAALILGACVATEHLILMPDAEPRRTDRAYQGYEGAKSIAVARRDAGDDAGRGAGQEFAAEENPDAGKRVNTAPKLQIRVFQQARMSW